MTVMFKIFVKNFENCLHTDINVTPKSLSKGPSKVSSGACSKGRQGQLHNCLKVKYLCI